MEIKVIKNILGENDRIAAENQAMFQDKKVFVLNFMGSPGAGKTSVLEKTMERLKDKINMAVIEGDLFTSKDAERIDKYGVPVIQINTAGGCHLDANMVQKTVKEMNLDELDLLVVENVGNLVCPAEFPVGEDARALKVPADVQGKRNRLAEQGGFGTVLQLQYGFGQEGYHEPAPGH